MSLTSLFVIDPPDRLDPPTDTSLALMRESVRRGHRVFFCTLAGLRLQHDQLRAKAYAVRFIPGRNLFETGEETELEPAKIDILHMRKDPPVDETYLHATFLLDRLPGRVLQVNSGRALRRHCEKLIPCHFPDLMPETVVTSDPSVLKGFVQQLGKAVVKPLQDCSGRGVFMLHGDQQDLLQRCREATRGGRNYAQGQQFLPCIGEGDKRILLLGGKILGWLRRVPAAGDFRSNVNAGGVCVPCDLNEFDRAICTRLGPWLVGEGIHLAGVDIVGDKVLEVNITSPSCLREMNDLSGAKLESRILDYLEALIPR